MGTAAAATGGTRGSQQGLLLLVLLVEIVIFGLTGRNFLTIGNAAEVTRLSVEIGLLAVALTPVIVGGGIDLSVGALLGLTAVVFGWLWRDGGLPVGVAAVVAIGVGAVGGSLNGLLVTRLRLPPLIVTLGSLSLFRGLATGLTGGTETYTGFPDSFLTLGQGYLAGIPFQLPVLVAVVVGYWLLLHRTTHGRAVFAIGFSPEGARHAGIPVERRVFTLYLLSGLAASLAGVVYVARMGQAKADAGTGYELAAITAVVLGGTSIFGGRGGIGGTVLGLLVIAVLDNGLLLADLPRELAGALTGVLLLVTITLDRLRSRPAADTPSPKPEGEFEMKNSQLAVLCAVILIAAGIVAAGNWYLVKSLQPPPPKKITIAMMPKSKGNPYFVSCHRGAVEAAGELDVELIWDGPDGTDPAGQNRIVEGWITRGVDVICVAVENREGLSPVLRKARLKGIKVVTWDADADPDARDFFVNQATPQGIGNALMDTAAKVMGNKGEFAIITGSLTASNLNEWRKHVEARLKKEYPDIKLVDTRPCDDQQKKALDETKVVLAAHPNVKLVMAVCSPAVPGAAEAIKQLGRTDVKVVGLGLPNENKPFVHEGITDTVILWNTGDLGYLTVYAAKQVGEGKLTAGASGMSGGRLGRKDIDGANNILLGRPFAFTKENIDQFDF
jgi:rhamnose transport system permease protein